MNVLLLTSEIFPNWGGIGTYVMELARHMTDVTIHIVAPKRTQLGDKTFNDDRLQEACPDNVSIHYLGTAQDTFKHYLSFQLACWKHVPRLVEKHQIDVIHSQNTMPDLFLSPRKLGVPIVTTIHTLDNDRVPAIIKAAKSSGPNSVDMHGSEKMSLLFARAVRMAGRAYFRNNRNYIAVSEWSKERLLLHYRIEAERVRVIHNGVDLDRFTPHNAKFAEQYFPSLVDLDGPKILFASRLTAFKGIHVLMEAIPHVLGETDAHFIFAGHGDALPTHNYQQNITELGYISYRLMPYLFALADVVVLPSFYENFPLSLLEAMASGCPAIASRVGGIPELIRHGENGLLIRSGSVDDLTGALLTLITNDALRTKIGHNARRSVEDRFEWRRVAAEVSEYYDSLVAESI